MKKELAVSFNVVLPREVFREIADLQKELSSRFQEKRFYDSSPHLAIVTKFMSKADSEIFVDTIRKSFENEKPWTITLDGFTLSAEGRYVFLNLDKKSRDKIFGMNNQALKVTKRIGAEGMLGQPPKYPYDPHISIIKVDEGKGQDALAHIGQDLRGRKIAVNAFEITREEPDKKGYVNFPTITTIKLASGK